MMATNAIMLAIVHLCSDALTTSYSAVSIQSLQFRSTPISVIEKPQQNLQMLMLMHSASIQGSADTCVHMRLHLQ